jgi:SPP1 gp7 family putative phage head morphogenesis protein
MGLFRRESREVEVMERRDPSAATQPLRWIPRDQATAPDWDAASAFELAYYMNVVVYACVRLQANVLSSCPFRVGNDPAKPQDYDPNAPLARLLGPPPGGPAAKLSARRLWAWTVAQRVVTGRNGWEIEKNGDAIAALWPLASSSLKPIKSHGGVEWFSGFEYGRPGDEKKLTNDHIVYDWSPSGTDFREPESDLRAANLDIAVSIMQMRYDYSFLRNDARPAAIVVTEAFEDEDSRRAFETQWNSKLGGVDNAGRSVFVEAAGAGDQGVKGAVDVTVLGISQKDAQAAQRHTAAMERTAIALGTPWSLLDASGRTFSNAGQEWTNWATTRVVPMCRDFADMVNMQLAPMIGDGKVGWFDLSSLGIEEAVDPVTAQVGAPAMVQAQLMTVNEARADYRLPPVADGDRFMTPEEIAALSGGGQQPVRVAAPNLPAQVDGAREEPTRGAPVEGVREIPPSPAPVDHEERRARIWKITDSRIRNLERQWERALRKLFARQARSAIARLEGKRGRTLVRGRDARATAGEVFDPDHWLDETVDDVTALYESVMAAGGARVAELFGIAFDIEAPYAQEFIQARANQLAGQVTDTTYSAIKDALADGVSEGEGIPELAARIKHVFEVATDSRATTIARTEVISGFNGSAALTAAEYGEDVVAGQEWIATNDGRTRVEHAERDGEIVPIGETFSGGLAYPGDPSGDAADTVNCRCTVAFLTPEEMAERSGGRAPRMVERRVALAAFRAWDGTDRTLVRDAWRLAA